jgi:pimeloyl-ACP methyl ester carboxylesterase
MADFAAKVIQVAGKEPIDVLGWSLGGFVGQLLAIKYPAVVRTLVLAGTMPPGGAPELTWSRAWLERASAAVPTAENALALLYAASDASRQAGTESLGRTSCPPAAYVSPATMATQADAIGRYADGFEGNWYACLREITAPTFVADGDRDGLFPPIDSVVLAREILRRRINATKWPARGPNARPQSRQRFTLPGHEHRPLPG